MKTFILYLSLMFTTFMQAQLKPIDYLDNTQKLQGQLALPKKNLTNKPGVLVLPAWMGIDTNAKENAAELAKLG